MATPYQIRELQRAINSFNARYSLGQPHVAVDSIYGAQTAEESRWMQYLLGMPTNQVGHWPILTVTTWLYHPTLYWNGPPKRQNQYNDHLRRLAAVRAPKHGGHNLTTYRGVTLVSWIEPKMAKHGMGYGNDGDQFCGWRGPRGSGLQAWLYKRWLAGLEPGPVAEPGYSMHEYCDCATCRQDIARLFGISTSDAIGGAVDARDPYAIEDNDLKAAGSSDPPHASSRRYQNATGRY